jgi:hypothetical protein
MLDGCPLEMINNCGPRGSSAADESFLLRADGSDRIVGGARPFAAVHKSASDAVDGSSTRHVSAIGVGPDKAPTIRRS